MIHQVDADNWRDAVAVFGNPALELMARAYVFGEPGPELVYDDGGSIVAMRAGETELSP